MSIPGRLSFAFWIALTAVHAAPLYQATFIKPASGNLLPQALNDRGEIVGIWDQADGTHQFLYTNGTFLDFKLPAGSENINNLGVAVFTNSIYANGTLTVFNAGSNIPGNAFVSLKSINDSGSLAGNYGVPNEVGQHA